MRDPAEGQMTQHEGQIWFLPLSLGTSPQRHICWWTYIEFTIHTIIQNIASAEITDKREENKEGAWDVVRKSHRVM